MSTIALRCLTSCALLCLLAGAAFAAPRIVNYDIAATITPETQWLKATARTDWETDVRAGQLQVALRTDLRITRLAGPDGAPLQYSRDAEGAVTVPLPTAIEAGSRFSLTFEYEGRVHGPMGGASGKRVWDHIGPEGTYVRFEAEWYPMIWGNRATADVALTVPEGWSAVTSGKLVRREGNTSTWHIAHATPGISFTAAPYVVKETTVGNLPVQSYLFPAHAGRADEFIQRCGEILALYNELYSPYPFEKFAIAEIPDLYGGGHGDQSFIMLQEHTFTQPFDTEFVGHEMAHNWWGGILTCTESEFLIEAFPTYSQALCRERLEGTEAFRRSMKDQAESVLMASLDPEKEVSCYKSDSGPLLYEKGSWILHMLRFLMGDAKWMAMVKGFVQDNQGRDVTCAQFQQACEEAYGGSLDWFFQQWLYGTGVPWVKAKITGFAGNTATVRLTQALVKGEAEEEDDTRAGAWQTTPSSFALPIELLLKCGGQEVRRQIWLRQPQQDVEVNVPAQPTEVIVDPDGWVLDHSKGLVGELDADMAGLEEELERELGDLGKTLPR